MRPTASHVPLRPSPHPVTVRHCAEARFPAEPPGPPVLHIGERLGLAVQTVEGECAGLGAGAEAAARAHHSRRRPAVGWTPMPTRSPALPHATAWCGRVTSRDAAPVAWSAAHDQGATHTPFPEAEPAAQRCRDSPPSPSLSDLCAELLASPPSPPPDGTHGCLLTLAMEGGGWAPWQSGAVLYHADPVKVGPPSPHRQDTTLSPFTSSLHSLPTICPGEAGGMLVSDAVGFSGLRRWM